MLQARNNPVAPLVKCSVQPVPTSAANPIFPDDDFHFSVVQVERKTQEFRSTHQFNDWHL